MAGTVRIEGDDVVLELHGVDEFLSFKRSIRIPLKHIKSVSAEPVSWDEFNAWKLVGANLPHVIKDGLFLSKEGKIFFEMHHPEKCITLTLDHESYKEVVFEVDDKESVVMLIENAISNEEIIHSGDEGFSDMNDV